MVITDKSKRYDLPTSRDLHRKISDQIFNDIQTGRLGLGDKLPSQSELQQQYKVSVGTIRQSLAVLERRGIIRKVNGLGSFVSLQSNRPQESKKLRTIGLIFERISYADDRDSQMELMMAFSDECRKQGIRLMIAETDFDAHLSGSKLIETFRDVTIDGVCVFLHEPRDASERIGVLGSEFEAAVAFFPGPAYESMPIDTVDINCQAGVEQLMDYLIALGHERIGYVGIEVDYTDEMFQNMRRFATYKNSLKKAGFPLNRDYVVDYPYGRELSGETMEKVLGMVRRKDPVTAIFACSDWLAWNIIYYFWQNGIRVPQDIAVVGYDGVEMSKSVIPPLTTVACPYDSVVQAAVDLLTKRLADPKRPIQKISLPSRLTVRKSVISVNEMTSHV